MKKLIRLAGKSEQSPSKKAEELNGFVCPVCYDCFPSSRELSLHFESHENKGPNDVSPKSPESIISEIESQLRDYCRQGGLPSPPECSPADLLKSVLLSKSDQHEELLLECSRLTEESNRKTQLIAEMSRRLVRLGEGVSLLRSEQEGLRGTTVALIEEMESLKTSTAATKMRDHKMRLLAERLGDNIGGFRREFGQIVAMKSMMSSVEEMTSRLGEKLCDHDQKMTSSREHVKERLGRMKEKLWEWKRGATQDVGEVRHLLGELLGRETGIFGVMSLAERMRGQLEAVGSSGEDCVAIDYLKTEQVILRDKFSLDLALAEARHSRAVESLQSEVDTLRGCNIDMSNEISCLSEELEAATAERTALNEEVGELGRELELRRSTSEEMANRVGMAVQCLRTMGASLSSLRADCSQLSGLHGAFPGGDQRLLGMEEVLVLRNCAGRCRELDEKMEGVTRGVNRLVGLHLRSFRGRLRRLSALNGDTRRVANDRMSEFQLCLARVAREVHRLSEDQSSRASRLLFLQRQKLCSLGVTLSRGLCDLKSSLATLPRAEMESIGALMARTERMVGESALAITRMRRLHEESIARYKLGTCGKLRDVANLGCSVGLSELRSDLQRREHLLDMFFGLLEGKCCTLAGISARVGEAERRVAGLEEVLGRSARGVVLRARSAAVSRREERERMTLRFERNAGVVNRFFVEMAGFIENSGIKSELQSLQVFMINLCRKMDHQFGEIMAFLNIFARSLGIIRERVMGEIAHKDQQIEQISLQNLNLARLHSEEVSAISEKLSRAGISLEKSEHLLAQSTTALREVTAEKSELEREVGTHRTSYDLLMNEYLRMEEREAEVRAQLAGARLRNVDLTTAIRELGSENSSLQVIANKISNTRWSKDSECSSCFKCGTAFSLSVRRHHCRNCGSIFCNACTSETLVLPSSPKRQRVCDQCFSAITNRRNPDQERFI